MVQKDLLVENNEIFLCYANDFFASAETPENMVLFSGIAITAWNLSFNPENEVDQKIESFQKRIGLSQFTNGGRIVPLKEKILELIKLKNDTFVDHAFQILKADFESNDEGAISIIVTTREVDKPK